METTLELPVLSQARLRALALLADATANPVEIASVVGSDPALTALALRAANSAFSAPRDRVTRVHDAVVRIGMLETRQIIAAAVLTRAFRNLQRAGIDEREMWRHAILCALLAEGITNQAPNTQLVRDAAVAAGLLHDVGRLQEASSDPRGYRRVVELVSDGAAPLDAEREVFGSDHLEWGDAVAGACRLPADVRSAIVEHHEAVTEDRAREHPLSEAVARAHGASFALGVGNGLPQIGPAPGDLSTADRRLVVALGGAEELLARIESFRQAVV